MFFKFHTVADSIQIYDMYMMAYVHAISCDKMSLQHPSGMMYLKLQGRHAQKCDGFTMCYLLLFRAPGELSGRTAEK